MANKIDTVTARNKLKPGVNRIGTESAKASMSGFAKCKIAQAERGCFDIAMRQEMKSKIV
ncbi:hypothetical protein [Janthinobacterium lividum]|uniref:hypothetical protein n=1 Tax=Janthinobacterium lividum TaxID=29581 RepID=UPI00140BF407|nr:hypothetical protein [Janthinobacterium lividum]NHQ90528.1 hypothetical protein [Janthinobacterium lividum]